VYSGNSNNNSSSPISSNNTFNNSLATQHQQISNSSFLSVSTIGNGSSSGTIFTPSNSSNSLFSNTVSSQSQVPSHSANGYITDPLTFPRDG
jgi:hypothetical protein